MYQAVSSGTFVFHGADMAPRSKDSRVRFLEPLATDVAAFRAAMGMGVTEIGLIRSAVRAYMDAQLNKDDELKMRYRAEREKLIAEKRQPIRLVKSDREPSAKFPKA